MISDQVSRALNLLKPLGFLRLLSVFICRIYPLHLCTNIKCWNGGCYQKGFDQCPSPILVSCRRRLPGSKLSYLPGEKEVAFHCTARTKNYSVEIARINAVARVVSWQRTWAHLAQKRLSRGDGVCHGLWLAGFVFLFKSPPLGAPAITRSPCA